MAENNLKLDENEVHYVYGDQEYVLGEDELNPELRDLLCGDGSRAILVDGQYIVANNQTILLQEGDTNFTQYYINNCDEGFVVDGEDTSTSTNTLLDSTECVQLVEEDTDEGQQVIYYTNDDSEEPQQEEELARIQDEEGNVYSFKRIKLEGQMLNFDEFVQQNLTESENGECSMEYTILEDDSSLRDDSQPEESTSENVEKPNQVDISNITGRNLITGQTVTLRSYMEKLKKRLNKSSHGTRRNKRIYNDATNVTLKSCDEETKKPELDDLLDKRISIGKTKNGKKKIVGKIIHVERKERREENGRNEEEEEARNEDQNKILVRKTVSAESFEQISKTLGGVMEMESVRKKLDSKNIVVKLVEKKWVSETESYHKNTSYAYGYMEQELGCVDDEVVEKWKFVLDQDTQDVLLREHLGIREEDGRENTEKTTPRFPITTSLTILITYEKAGNKTIRVNLNPAPGNLCTVCAQCFPSNLQLRQHMNHAHNTFGSAASCEICEKTFDDLQELHQHRDVHVQEGRLFVCSKCSKCFASQSKLQKHLNAHDTNPRPLKCLVCDARCTNKWTWKKHLLSHTEIKKYSCEVCSKQFTTQYDANFHKKIHLPEKVFSCNICMRTFSRHSNLLRHTEIHTGTGALYKCEICYCSYNYISSLTRHMVQNHINAGDFRKNLE